MLCNCCHFEEEPEPPARVKPGWGRPQAEEMCCTTMPIGSPNLELWDGTPFRSLKRIQRPWCRPCFVPLLCCLCLLFLLTGAGQIAEALDSEMSFGEGFFGVSGVSLGG